VRRRAAAGGGAHQQEHRERGDAGREAAGLAAGVDVQERVRRRGGGVEAERLQERSLGVPKVGGGEGAAAERGELLHAGRGGLRGAVQGGGGAGASGGALREHAGGARGRRVGGAAPRCATAVALGTVPAPCPRPCACPRASSSLAATSRAAVPIICSAARGTPRGSAAARKRSSSAAARCSVPGCRPRWSAASPIQATTTMRACGVTRSGGAAGAGTAGSGPDARASAM
jgi:hypothetical protein